jgi:hypothetical protein
MFYEDENCVHIFFGNLKAIGDAVDLGTYRRERLKWVKK